MKTSEAVDRALFDDLPRQRDPVLYICHKAEGIEIEQRRDDGYIDATAMCRAYGDTFAHYRDNQRTQTTLEALEKDLNIPIRILVQSEVGGRHGGTWVHPEVAVDLAQHLSPIFRIRVNRWILQWMQGRPPALHTADLEPFVIGRLVQETHAMAQETHAMAKRILDNTAHIDQNTETTAVDVKEMRVDLWRVIGEALPTQTKQPAPPACGSRGQPIPKMVGPRKT
jgi:phenylpyruvate tautomerase PptA (4-oxalocrotonate tautomerase family)